MDTPPAFPYGKIMPERLKINPENPLQDQIIAAAKVIQNGGLLMFPTTCLYGLGADAFNAQAVERIFEIKGRSRDKAILVLIQDKKDLERLVRKIPSAAVRIMDRFWPGKVTLVFEARKNLVPALTAGIGKIGVRMCGHRIGAELIRAAGCPITGTSANLAGRPGVSRVSDLETEVIQHLDLIVDAGELKGGVGSTVVDISSDYPEILRQGTMPATEILALF